MLQYILVKLVRNTKNRQQHPLLLKRNWWNQQQYIDIALVWVDRRYFNRLKKCLEKIPPMVRYLKNNHPLISGSRGLRGCLSMMSRSGGLNPRAVAGKPSVTKLTQRSWTGMRASGRPMIAVRKMLKENKVTKYFQEAKKYYTFLFNNFRLKCSQ